MNMAWYVYIGGNPNAVTSYTLVQVQPPCLNGTILCAILAPFGPNNRPASIPAGLQTNIANALATGVAQPQPIPPLQPEVLLRD